MKYYFKVHGAQAEAEGIMCVMYCVVKQDC